MFFLSSFLVYSPIVASLGVLAFSQTRYYRTPRELPPLTLAFGVGRPLRVRRAWVVGRSCLRALRLSFCMLAGFVYFLDTVLRTVYKKCTKHAFIYLNCFFYNCVFVVFFHCFFYIYILFVFFYKKNKQNIYIEKTRETKKQKKNEKL